MMKKILPLLLTSFLGAFIALFIQDNFDSSKEYEISRSERDPVTLQTTPVNTLSNSSEMIDLTEAAENTINAVVHVKNRAFKSYNDPIANLFFGRGSSRDFSQLGTGSGVIISGDGYIITNNHVIEDATEIEIVLNDKSSFIAEVIGTDLNSDIALLKIDADNLTYIPFGDSDSMRIGEWVLAVGNPYNLTSTVTAGIISAKGRDLEGNFSTDSFLQTDAAVNPGNSGGALVNNRGELIGINTAISSQTGSFVGYSFAVPSNIAQKIVSDFMEFGSVQKVLLGIRPSADEEDKINGVEIAGISDMGNAGKSGFQTGDVIIEMDGLNISNFSDLKGYLRSKRPGDEVLVSANRSGELIKAKVKLIKDDTVVLRKIGMVVKDLDKRKAKSLDLDGGIEIVDLAPNYFKRYGIERGYVIVQINNVDVENVSDLENALRDFNGRQTLFMEMYDKNGTRQKFVFN
jgi:S1-C subfamily serine protease